jgi:hypothetical protein
MKFGFIARNRTIWRWHGYDALGVSRSDFQAWLTRSPSAGSRSDEDPWCTGQGELPRKRSHLRRTGSGVNCSPMDRDAVCAGSSG